ncbi:MAG: hypothetical protein GX369_00200 [Euryarchaeota archaeon]|nr:hypothetical protein [Euryarchaeota archaeon]
MPQKTTHEKLSEAGKKGGKASRSGRDEEREGMSREEAGRMGGEKVAEERGSEFYSEIGKEGAKAQPREAKEKGGRHSHGGKD